MPGTTSPVIAGDIGLPVISRFRLIIDYSHEQVYAVPYGDQRSLGAFVLKHDDGFAVNFIAPDSPAQASGFKAGDTIAAIDGKPAQSWSQISFDELRYRSGGTSVSFTLQTAPHCRSDWQTISEERLNHFPGDTFERLPHLRLPGLVLGNAFCLSDHGIAGQ